MDGYLDAGEPHIPSLAWRVVELFGTAEGDVVVDCTLGYGGHAERILASENPPALLVGIDRDPEALEAAARRLARFGARARVYRGRFSEIDSILATAGVETVAGVLYDLGVSSPQLDRGERGFSYTRPGPLDMRMDPDWPVTAADVVNGYPEDRLARVIRRYGEERHAARIAREIVRRRPLRTTADLAAAVEAALPKKTYESRRPAEPPSGPAWTVHPARRTFQAIRIEVNRELEELETSLPKALRALRIPAREGEHGGRLVCIAYHSLEDRIVKRFFDDQGGRCKCPPELPVCACGARPLLRRLTRRPVRPSRAEVESNPRARSARLRAAERTQETLEPAPVRPHESDDGNLDALGGRAGGRR